MSFHANLVSLRDENMSVNEVSALVHMSIKDIQDFKTQQDKKKSNIEKVKKEKREKTSEKMVRNVTGESQNDSYMNILVEIRDLLRVIANK